MKRMLIVAMALTGALHPRAGARDKTLDIYWIDAEGGAATLIVTPAGESVLIDTGYPDTGPPRIHKVATEVAGLKRIDNLIVTHFHNDHFGGTVPLSKLMPIDRVFDNGVPVPAPNEKDAPQFNEYVAFATGKRRLLKPGDVIPLTQAPGAAPIELRLIATRQQRVRGEANARENPECAGAVEKPVDNSDNANSTVWVLAFGPFHFFDGGDLTWNNEARLVCPTNLVGQVDVYQTDHHGLALSNNPVLIRSLAPIVSIMNNGPRKGTEPEAVATLKSIPSLQARYQVHKNLRDDGANSTSDEYIANIESPCAARYLKLTVEPTGRQYTIEIPGREHRRTYETRHP